uniref:Uncharacterized protein n=1 Tax=Parastrongyloides trichosuri TaxID=131310 RepID=A0A0N4ZQM5_PARTI
MWFGRKIVISFFILILLRIHYGESFKLKSDNRLEPYEDSEYIWNKRTFEDPRLYTASFGKRNVPKQDGPVTSNENNKNIDIRYEKKSNDYEDIYDPRFYSTAFGKRSIGNRKILILNTNYLPLDFGKRDFDIDDPRLYSAAFGK